MHKTCLGPKLKNHDVLIPILCRISGHFSTFFLLEGTAKVSFDKRSFSTLQLSAAMSSTVIEVIG